MEKENTDSEKSYSTKKAIFYSFATISDTISYQMFTFLIFTFYYSVVGLNVNLITIGFILWSIWNAINDPLLGVLSDRTKSKWGRRKPYIVGGIGPLCLILILLWTPPLGSAIITFIYFLIIIILFDLFYTMYSMNQTSLFPEIFQDLEERAKANNILQIFNIIGLIFAMIAPSFFIPRYDDPQYITNYAQAGIFMAILTLLFALIFIKFGLKERIEYSKDPEKAPSFKDSLIITFKSKAYRYYLIANFATWYVIGMLPTIAPLYCSFVLNIKNSTIISLLLGLTFISASLFMFLWRYLIIKTGVKLGLILAFFSLILTLLPFMFIYDLAGAIMTFIMAGLGISGLLFCRDPTIGAIIDLDEINTGIRREASYYSIGALITRLTTIAIALSISLVFTTVGWTIFNPKGDLTRIILGLRILIFIFPSIALIFGILAMLRFPINKEKYEKIKQELENLHYEKRKTFSKNP